MQTFVPGPVRTLSPGRARVRFLNHAAIRRSELNVFTRFLLLAVLILALAPSLWAGMDDGRAAYERQDYTLALREFGKLAQEGNAGAQYAVGVMYAEGQGVAREIEAAVQWFRKAADQGEPRAEFRLGLLCYDGQGLPQSYKEAARWFRRAADHGHAPAQFDLAMMYASGLGVPENQTESVKWLRLASAQGLGEAQNNLAIAFDTGTGVRHSDIAAHALYTLAAATRVSPSRQAAGNRLQLAERMSKEDIAQAEALAAAMGKPGRLLEALDEFLKGR